MERANAGQEGKASTPSPFISVQGQPLIVPVYLQVMPSVKKPTGGLSATLARPVTRSSKMLPSSLQTTTGLQWQGSEAVVTSGAYHKNSCVHKNRCVHYR